MFKDLFNSRYVLATDRMAWIDYARGICIILVCYRHCFEGLVESNLPTYNYPVLEVLNVCFFSFRMPLFFIISGMFVSHSLVKKKAINYIDSRFRIVFYPLLVWGSIQITLQLIFKNYVNADRQPYDYINLIILPRRIEQFWYLNALFFVGAIYAAFKAWLKFNTTMQMMLGVVLFSISGYFNYEGMGIKLGFLLDVFHYYIYFCIGDLVASFIFKKEAAEVLTSYKWLGTSFVLFLITQTIFTVYNMRNSTETFVNQKLPYLFFLISLSGCIFMIQLAFLLQKKGILKWLRVIGYHSLYIYLVHLMVIAAIRVFMLRILHIQNIPAIIVVAITAGVIIPVIMYNLAVRSGIWWLFSLKKPKNEINHYTSLSATT